MSDTMISDREQVRDNIIPGRLKSIVINEWLTVSYAGLSTQAIDAIRTIKNYQSVTTRDSVDFLLDISASFPNDLDFIVCSHETEARLIKISNGRLMEGANAYWIGSSQAASELSRVLIRNARFESLPEYISAEEIEFKNAFNTYMRENTCEGIGGAVIDCLCSPYGHGYNSHAGAFSWDTVILGMEIREDLNRRKNTGTYHYEYHVLSPSVRGQGIVGFYLDQAQVGFIYDPINHDDALKIEGASLSNFSKLVEDVGQVLSRVLHNNSSKRDAGDGAPY